ncbi:MAG: hypothetical protein ACREPN_10095 [Rudaea sp.]
MEELGKRLTESEAVRRYGLVRAGIADGVAVTFLDLDAEEIRVVAGGHSDPAVSLAMSIGYGQVARTCFRHAPPTPGEIETAIAVVEDELMKYRFAIPRNSALFATNNMLNRIAQAAGDEGNEILGVELVEATFERLAAIVLGRPAAQDAIPTDAGFAAALTILREFMHHFGFESVTILPA